ncbi:MAG: hypothetical protein LH480_12380 [Rubrivivax sp.]|nr:hypothetical protein [Rubrivivax sp.]
MDALVDQVAEMMRHDLAAKDIDFVCVPGARVVRVAADPVRMQQVVWNIIRNAVKFTPRGGQIRIQNTIDGNDFVMTCTDSVVGIEAAALARIFVAYEQGSTGTYQRYGGLGLGPAIPMGIVEGHGGKLAAAGGGPDKAATFTFRLPLGGRRHNPAPLLGK